MLQATKRAFPRAPEPKENGAIERYSKEGLPFCDGPPLPSPPGSYEEQILRRTYSL